MRRLLPEPATDVDVLDLVSELQPWKDAPASRPYVITNFALTLDGRATIDGRSREIGSDRDTEMLVGLRTRVDAVMIGGGTMRAEGYGRVVADPAKRERREQAGLSRDPLMVIVSGRLDLPWDAPLFREPGRIVVFTASADDPPRTEADIEIVRHDTVVDIPEALRHLREEHGVTALLCEGGGYLHGQLHEANAVDEMFVTHAPKVAGGEGPGLVEGLDAALRPLEVRWLVSEPETGELFARYAVRPRAG